MSDLHHLALALAESFVLDAFKVQWQWLVQDLLDVASQNSIAVAPE